jgi:hypothetical protein
MVIFLGQMVRDGTDPGGATPLGERRMMPFILNGELQSITCEVVFDETDFCDTMLVPFWRRLASIAALRSLASP